MNLKKLENQRKVSKINRKTLLIIFIGLSQIVMLGSVFEIQETNALQVSNPDIDNIVIDLGKTNVYHKPDIFYFDIKNDDNAFITVYPRAKVLNLTNWQQNFTIEWNEKSVWLPPNATFRFVPNIIFEVDLSYNYTIHFIFEATQEINHQDIHYASRGDITTFNILTIKDGHAFTLRTTDQANYQRLSQINIKYGGNYSQGYNWQTIRTMRQSYYSSIFQAGWYEIIAVDIKTGLSKQEIFRLTESKELNIVYEIIKFSSLVINKPDSVNSPLNFYFEVENNYLEIDGIDVVFQISSHDNKRQQLRQTIPFFKEGVIDGNLSFMLDWRSGEYLFEAKIMLGEKIYSEENTTISMSFDFFENLIHDPITPYLIIGFTFVIGTLSGIGLFYSVLILKKEDSVLRIRYRKYKEDRLERKKLQLETKEEPKPKKNRLKNYLSSKLPFEIKKKEKQEEEKENDNET
ncbi:hypothetical protein LCGC14_0454000 [marine sediment metagenome]|uniref:Uncharacterized protein n=1 Tax=marine sediment metagenome TaxID=412755 RepID=A0A0F9SGZ3_9ZZZZ